MRGFFHFDSPIFQFLSRMADLMLLNLLFLICSLPVVTLGASLTAMHRVTQNMVFEQEEAITSAFFRAFRQNFRQATPVWLVMLVLSVCLVLDVQLVSAGLAGSLASAMYILVAVVAILAAAVYSYIMPLIARYENTLSRQVHNATVLAIVKLPRTILLVVLNLLPLALFLTSVSLFIQTAFFWLVIGFALTSYLGSRILKPVFQGLETASEEDTEA